MAVYYQRGDYWARLLNQQLGEASTGTLSIALTFEIRGMVDPSNPDGELIGCEQYERTVFMYLTDKTSEWVCDNLAKLGFRGKSFDVIDLEHPQTSDMRGVECCLTCEHDTYEGNEKEKWHIKRTGGGKLELTAPKKESVRKMNALFGKTLANKVAEVEASQEPEEETVPANSDGGDIPF